MRDWEQGKQQIRLGEVPVEKVQLDLKSRDDIPAVLRGLQALYCDLCTRKRLFELLESALGSDRDLGNGRPGMPMWSMLVLAVLKDGLNCDWDRLHELVNQHGAVREMLGDSRFGGQRYHRQTLIDNVSLLTPELLRAVGELVVSTGHEVVQHKAGSGLSARCDSFVVETDVRFPTDMGLLWDATRVAVRICSQLAGAQGLAGWRQRRHLVRQLRRRFQRVCTSRRWNANPAGSGGIPVRLSAATAAGCRDHGSIGRVPGGAIRTPPAGVAGSPSGRPDRASRAGGGDHSGLGEDFFRV